MSKMSFVAALIGAALVGAVVAVVVQPLVMPHMAADEMAPTAMTAPAADKPADAAAAEDEGEPVAVVNGEAITATDLSAFVQQLPPQLQAQVQLLMPQILEQLVNNELSTQAGRAAGLAEDAEVRNRVSKIEDLIVGQIYLTRAIEERVNDDKIEAAYQAFLQENPPQRQLQARHILVETEDEAKEIIAALDGGADFAELAKEKSTGPSGANGGELPPFTEGEMVPAFSDAAFAMEVGTHSSAPVKTQFGYHVIKLEGSTMSEPPAKAEVEGQLRDRLNQEAAEAIYGELREGAEIEILLGKPAEGAPAEGQDGNGAPAAPADN
ncbi:MAG: peptidylprolyl isomerase [Kiloniellaceae bacterium]